VNIASTMSKKSIIIDMINYCNFSGFYENTICNISLNQVIYNVYSVYNWLHMPYEMYFRDIFNWNKILSMKTNIFYNVYGAKTHYVVRYHNYINF
jgi:hypothetical protein